MRSPGISLEMAGYSNTPLAKKLGIKAGSRILLDHPPESLPNLLGPLPEGAQFLTDGLESVDLVVTFVKSQRDLRERFPIQAARIFPNGILWVSWPKKSSGVTTDLDENVVRDIGLAEGLVDVKVCAIDEIWSGLKFVIRLQDRPAEAKPRAAKSQENARRK
jgi:hypothetical protein